MRPVSRTDDGIQAANDRSVRSLDTLRIRLGDDWSDEQIRSIQRWCERPKSYRHPEYLVPRSSRATRHDRLRRLQRPTRRRSRREKHDR